MGRGWVIINYIRRPVMNGGQLPTNQLHHVQYIFAKLAISYYYALYSPQYI